MSEDPRVIAERDRISEDPERKALAEGYLQLVKRDMRAVISDAVRKAKTRHQKKEHEFKVKKQIKDQALQAIKDWHDGGMVDDFPEGILDAALGE